MLMNIPDQERVELLEFVRTLKNGEKYGNTPDLMQDIVAHLLNIKCNRKLKLISTVTMKQLFKKTPKPGASKTFSDEAGEVEKKWLELVSTDVRSIHYQSRYKNLSLMEKTIEWVGYEDVLLILSFIKTNEWWRKVVVDKQYSFVHRNYPSLLKQAKKEEGKSVIVYLMNDGSETEHPELFPDLVVVKEYKRKK